MDRIVFPPERKPNLYNLLKKPTSVAMKCKQTKVVLKVTGPLKQVSPIKPLKVDYGINVEPEGTHGFDIGAFFAQGVNHVLGWIFWALGQN